MAVDESESECSQRRTFSRSLSLPPFRRGHLPTVKMDFDNHPTADLDPSMIAQPEVLAPPVDGLPAPIASDDESDAGGLFGDDDDEE